MGTLMRAAMARGFAACDRGLEGDTDRVARPADSGGQRLPWPVLSCAISSSCEPKAASWGLEKLTAAAM